MKKSSVVILLLLLICTGCKAEYNLIINDDLTVDEEVIALEDSSFFDQYYKSTVSRVIDLVMAKNKEYLDYNGYNVDKIIANESGAKITKKHKSIDEFYDVSMFYTQLLPSFEYKADKNIITFNAEGAIYNDGNLVEKYKIGEATINIKVPFKVVNNNADKYDKKNNIYSWYINSNTEYKNVHIEFDISRKIKDYSSITLYSIVTIIIILVILFVAYFIRNKNKSNEI